MRPVFPVRLENGLVINGNEDFFLINDDSEYIGELGNDANGDRFTNIVGFDGSDLLKRCTNPNCRQIKPSTLGFGKNGRNSNPRKAMRRDQAQCIECRARKH